MSGQFVVYGLRADHNMFYLGTSANAASREKGHRAAVRQIMARENNAHDRYVYRFIKNNGFQNFEFVVLSSHATKREAEIAEKKLIEKHVPIANVQFTKRDQGHVQGSPIALLHEHTNKVHEFPSKTAAIKFTKIKKHQLANMVAGKLHRMNGFILSKA